MIKHKILKNKSVIISGSIALILLLLSVYVYVSNYRAHTQTLERYRAEVAQLRLGIAQQLAIQKQKDDYKQTIRKIVPIEKQLNKPVSQSVLVNKIEFIAKKSNVTIKDEQTEIVKFKKIPGKVLLNKKLRITGSYASIKRFITKLHTINVYINLISVDLKRKASGLVDGIIQLSTYQASKNAE